MLSFGWVFQLNRLCDAPEFSNWRLDEFSNKTVLLTTRFLKRLNSSHDVLMDEFSSEAVLEISQKFANKT